MFTKCSQKKHTMYTFICYCIPINTKEVLICVVFFSDYVVTMVWMIRDVIKGCLPLQGLGGVLHGVYGNY